MYETENTGGTAKALLSATVITEASEHFGHFAINKLLIFDQQEYVLESKGRLIHQLIHHS